MLRAVLRPPPFFLTALKRTPCAARGTRRRLLIARPCVVAATLAASVTTSLPLRSCHHNLHARRLHRLTASTPFPRPTLGLEFVGRFPPRAAPPCAALPRAAPSRAAPPRARRHPRHQHAPHDAWLPCVTGAALHALTLAGLFPVSRVSDAHCEYAPNTHRGAKGYHIMTVSRPACAPCSRTRQFMLV